MKYIRIAGFVAVSALLATACGDDAGEYPSEAVGITIPFGPGGATDLGARNIADALSAELDVPFNPENREGANQVTAVSHVMDSDPAGYTLLADTNAAATLQMLDEDLPYDWEDRTFIGRVGFGSHIYAVNADSGIEDLDQLIAEIQENPSEFSVAWIGGRSFTDIVTLSLLDAAGVDADEVNLVPFTGSGDAMQSLAAGDVDFANGGAGEFAPLYDSGDLAPIALTGEDTEFDDIPLVDDLGHPELNMQFWLGLSGPADMDEDAVEVMSGAMLGLQDDDEFGENMAGLGYTVDVIVGGEWETYIEDEAETTLELNDLVN